MNMNNRVKTLISAVAAVGAILMLSATPALAGGKHGYDNGHHNRGHHYDRGHKRGHHYNRGYKRHHAYRGHRNARHYSDHRIRYDYHAPVQVIHHSPVYRQPTRSYYSTSTTYARGYRGNRVNAGNLVGGALGGYVGSTIGHGPGRLAATAAGAVIGYTLGGRVGAQY